MADAPNRSDVVNQVHADFPHLLRTNTLETCAEFCQRFIAGAGAGWGFTAKQGAENGYTWPHGVKTSHDVVTWLESGQPQSARRQVDIIKSAGASPSPGAPGWGTIPPHEYRTSNIWLDPSGFPVLNAGGGGGPTQKARLGFGDFPLVRAMLDWRSDAEANFDYVEQHLNPDYRRVMLFVEGSDHGNPDPWLFAGCLQPDGRWDDGYGRALDLAKSRSKKIYVTVFGGRHFDLHACCDRFLAATSGRWDLIEGVEVANEFKVNRFTPQQIKELGWYLKARLPGHIPLALSSPHSAHNPVSDNNELMGESYDELYGGNCPANEITVHLARNQEPEPVKWGDPFNHNIFYPDKKKTSGEPRGYEASAGGDIRDPAIFRADYERASGAGWNRYTTHARWCVFNGRTPHPYSIDYWERNVWNHDGIDGIFHALRDARHGNGGSGPLPPASQEWLESGHSLKPDQSRASADGRYTLLFQLDGNLVLYGPSGAVWNTKTYNAEPFEVSMQGDGNVVLYVKAPDGSGIPKWNSRTFGHPGARLLVQNDGNVVVYDAAGQPVKSILDDGGLL